MYIDAPVKPREYRTITINEKCIHPEEVPDLQIRPYNVPTGGGWIFEDIQKILECKFAIRSLSVDDIRRAL